MKRSLGAGEWIRRGLGVAVLAGVAAIALGLDTGLLTRVSLAGTSSVEQALIDKILPSIPGKPAQIFRGHDGRSERHDERIKRHGRWPGMMMAAKPAMAKAALPVEGTMPSLAGAAQWLNSPPLTAEALRGKVVLVDFWTYSCINCLRTLPYVRAWAEKYKDQGLVVIGVHAPEFAFEKDIDNVAQGRRRIGRRISRWRSTTTMRSGGASTTSTGRRTTSSTPRDGSAHHHFGEGEYEQSEKIIQQLLMEAGAGDVAKGVVTVAASGAEVRSRT